MSGFAFALETHARSVIHSGGNAHLERLLVLYASFAAALWTVRGDGAPRAAAIAAGARDAKESLLIAELPAATASAAGLWLSSSLRSRASAFVADLGTRNFDARF